MVVEAIEGIIETRVLARAEEEGTVRVLGRNLLSKIIKQAGLSVEEFNNL